MTDLGGAPSVSLASAMRGAIEGELLELHVSMPARVVAFDPDHQRCDVQPSLRRVVRTADGGEEELALPVITHVPIVYPSAGGWRLTFPLAIGDTVSLVFSERSLDEWLDGDGGLVTPGPGRRHALSDAQAYPGLRPFGSPIPGIGTTDMVLGREDGSNEIRLRPDGSILIGPAADQAMVRGNALNEYLTQRLSVLTPMGPSGPSTVPLEVGRELSEKAKVK